MEEKQTKQLLETCKKLGIGLHKRWCYDCKKYKYNVVSINEVRTPPTKCLFCFFKGRLIFDIIRVSKENPNLEILNSTEGK